MSPFTCMDGKLLDVFSITPFGVYCKKCSGATELTHNTLTERGILEHLNFHFLTASPESRKEFVAFVKVRQTEIRNKGDYGNYVICTTMQKCCVHCKVAFSKTSNANRHAATCSQGRIEDRKCVKTLCHRFIMRETLTPGIYHHLSFRPYDSSLDWINKHVRDDEPADGYLSMLHAFLCVHDDAEAAIRQRLEWANNPVSPGEIDLKEVISAGVTWFNERSSYDINMLSPNIRAKMIVFDPKQVDEVVVNTGFTARRTTSKTCNELTRLLRFAWRHTGHQLWQSEQNAFPCEADPFIIPRMLMKLTLESANQSIFDIPVMMEFCITRLFKERNDDLVIVESDYSSSMLSAVLYLLRAGACSHVYGVGQNHIVYGIKLANEICTADVVQMISRSIRQLRTMASNKHQSERRRVSANGDIIIGQAVFRGSIWRQLIPILNIQGRKLIGKIIGTQGDINHWLNESNQLRLIKNSHPIKMTITLPSGRVLHNTSLSILPNTWLRIGELRALCAFALFGLGGGCCRGSELNRLPHTHSSLSNNCLYYSVRKIKQVSCLYATNGHMIEHKLPPMLSRLVLLMRYICELCGCDTSTLIPAELPDAPSSMEALAQQIFSLHSPPVLLTLRQMFASISNYIFDSPSHPGGEMSTSPDGANLFGHSEVTHAKHYKSFMNDGGESLFNFWHVAFGEKSASTVQQNFNPTLTSSQLQEGMVAIFGVGARFRTTSQKSLLESLITGKNVMGNIPCGAGKSLAFVLPTVVEILQGCSRSRVLIVCPYKFLASSHMANVIKLIDGKLDVTCETLTMNDCLEKNKLEVFYSQEAADIYFLSLEAIHYLLYNKKTELLELIASGGIRRIVLDECHTIYNEQFRSHYEVLSRMSLLGIPIILLTGTLPIAWEEKLCTKLQMRSEADIIPRVMYVHGEDVMGNYPDSFNFSVHNFRSHKDSMAEVKRVVGEILATDPTSQIQVMCQTKAMADELSDGLSRLQHVSEGHALYDMMQGNESFRVVSLSSATPESTQQTVASDWTNGRITCLVSTTCALVGTENKACKHLIVAGILYNVMTFVQACKRLRPEQCENGSIRVIYSRKGHVRMLTPLKCQLDELLQVKKEDKRMLKLLQEEKLIGLTEEAKTRYMAVGSGLGLVSFLDCKVKCRLRDISERFGSRRTACGVCDNCKSGVETSVLMQQQQQQGESQATEEDTMRGRVYRMLLILERKCVFCGTTSCDGNDCIHRPNEIRCYFCDSGNHTRAMCKLSMSMRTELKNQVCFGCLDLSDFGPTNGRCMGMNMKKCNLQRRLKRLIVDDYKKVSESSEEEESFGQYYRRKTNQGKWLEYYDYLGREYRQLIGSTTSFMSSQMGGSSLSSGSLAAPARGATRNNWEERGDDESLGSYFSKKKGTSTTPTKMDGSRKKVAEVRKVQGKGSPGLSALGRSSVATAPVGGGSSATSSLGRRSVTTAAMTGGSSRTSLSGRRSIATMAVGGGSQRTNASGRKSAATTAMAGGSLATSAGGRKSIATGSVASGSCGTSAMGMKSISAAAMAGGSLATRGSGSKSGGTSAVASGSSGTRGSGMKSISAAAVASGSSGTRVSGRKSGATSAVASGSSMGGLESATTLEGKVIITKKGSVLGKTSRSSTPEREFEEESTKKKKTTMSDETMSWLSPTMLSELTAQTYMSSPLLEEVEWHPSGGTIDSTIEEKFYKEMGGGYEDYL